MTDVSEEARPKLYAERDLLRLKPHYFRHVFAMTVEKLHSKSDIAAELAYRDAEIARLLSDLTAARKALEAADRDEFRLDALERLAEQGHCPGVLNDDNGHWAVSGDGMQNCPGGDEPCDISTSFFVEAKDWKPTVREAIDAYIAEAAAEDADAARQDSP